MSRPINCEWERCWRHARGWRNWWRLGTRFRFHLCRPHQRQWDAGVRRRLHRAPTAEYDE